MAKKLNYTSQSLLDTKFTANVRGYDPVEVDKTFDLVIQDLVYYEDFKKEVTEYIQTIEKEIGELKQIKRDNEVEIARLKKRLSSIQDDPNVSKENVSLLKRIDELEKALYKKGVDPSKI